MPKKLIFLSVFRIRIILGLLDPEPDPLVGGTDPILPSFFSFQAKIIGKTFIPTVL
jgi:hypothetical protein